MKARIIFVLIVIITSFMLTACVDLSLPVYEKTDEDGTSVYIDGVRYKQLPELKWELIITHDTYEIIGYAGDRNTSITIDHTDTERNFIFLKGRYADSYHCMLYRADRNLPDVSVESVDRIEWEDYMVEDSEIRNKYKNTIEDKEIIKELFDLLDTGEKTENFSPIQNDAKSWIMNIRLYCSDIPGAFYRIEFGLDNGRLICGKPLTGYVYMPDDLLEKIAGKKIDIKELLSE